MRSKHHLIPMVNNISLKTVMRLYLLFSSEGGLYKKGKKAIKVYESVILFSKLKRSAYRKGRGDEQEVFS